MRITEAEILPSLEVKIGVGVLIAIILSVMVADISTGEAQGVSEEEEEE